MGFRRGRRTGLSSPGPLCADAQFRKVEVKFPVKFNTRVVTSAHAGDATREDWRLVHAFIAERTDSASTSFLPYLPGGSIPAMPVVGRPRAASLSFHVRSVSLYTGSKVESKVFLIPTTT